MAMTNGTSIDNGLLARARDAMLKINSETEGLRYSKLLERMAAEAVALTFDAAAEYHEAASGFGEDRVITEVHNLCADNFRRRAQEIRNVK